MTALFLVSLPDSNIETWLLSFSSSLKCVWKSRVRSNWAWKNHQWSSNFKRKYTKYYVVLSIVQHRQHSDLLGLSLSLDWRLSVFQLWTFQHRKGQSQPKESNKPYRNECMYMCKMREKTKCHLPTNVSYISFYLCQTVSRWLVYPTKHC